MKTIKGYKIIKEIFEVLLSFIIFLLSIFLIMLVYQNYYMGNYIVQEQWINSSYNGQNYCDSCLWIRFYEGCNRYLVYYFKNQHKLDSRFSYGSIVNINFREVDEKKYISSVKKAIKYRHKCA